MGGEQLVEGRSGLVEQGAARRRTRAAVQAGGARPGVQADLAGVGLVEAGEDAQQRRLADAVGADQADALAGVQLEADASNSGPASKPRDRSEQLRSNIQMDYETWAERGHRRRSL